MNLTFETIRTVKMSLYIQLILVKLKRKILGILRTIFENFVLSLKDMIDEKRCIRVQHVGT